MPDGYGIFSSQIADAKQRHVILWQKIDDEVLFIDAQSGKKINPEGPQYGVEASAPIILVRLDDATPVDWRLPDVIQPFDKM